MGTACLYSFMPIIDGSSEVLILGTLPGPESLRLGQYYANPYNQFWAIVHGVYNETAAPSYAGKVAFLLGHGAALWDVFRSAERIGALDADIKNGAPNDIPGLLDAHAGIRKIILNGRTADKSFNRFYPGLGVEAVYVPSSSAAYAKMPIGEKIREWKAALLG